jgi:hypothetical protein
MATLTAGDDAGREIAGAVCPGLREEREPEGM